MENKDTWVSDQNILFSEWGWKQTGSLGDELRIWHLIFSLVRSRNIMSIRFLNTDEEVQSGWESQMSENINVVREKAQWFPALSEGMGAIFYVFPTGFSSEKLGRFERACMDWAMMTNSCSLTCSFLHTGSEAFDFCSPTHLSELPFREYTLINLTELPQSPSLLDGHLD